MEILDCPITVEQYIEICRASGLRRPIDQPDRIARMIAAANITLSCWLDGRPIAMLRAWSDWAWVCYVADLAVARPYQGSGIGRSLLECLGSRLGEDVQIVLVAAPEAMGFYKHIGFELSNSTFIVRRKR